MAKTDADSVYAAFMADICADPYDDVPRLILADWLEDHGAVKHAQFIRLQIEAAAATCGGCGQCRYCDAATQAAAILNVNTREGRRRKLWAGRLRDFWGVTFDYERGFVAEVNCAATLWRNWGKAFIKNQPVVRLRFGYHDTGETQPWATPQLLEESHASEAALGNAAIAWARQQAGLPPLAG